MHDKTERRPIIDPLLLMLKSRRVLVAVAALIIGAVLTALPDLAPVREELLVLVITLALAVIGGYSVEDATRAARSESPAVAERDLETLVRAVLVAVLDEVLQPGEPQDPPEEQL